MNVYQRFFVLITVPFLYLLPAFPMDRSLKMLRFLLMLNPSLAVLQKYSS